MIKKIYYHKLVRDKIPEIIEKSGGAAKFKKLTAKQFEKELLKKVGEESSALPGVKSKKELIDELADVIEVIDEIKKFKKITKKPETEAPVKQEGGSAKLQAIRLAMDQIEKQYGKGSIMRLGGEGEKYKIDVVSTGSIAVDLALGVGGLPRGRITEIFGPEASGKTTLALAVVAEALQTGGQ